MADPLDEEMQTHSIILSWESPWTEEPGELQSRGSQRVVPDGVAEHTHELSSREERLKVKASKLVSAGLRGKVLEEVNQNWLE